MRRTLKRADGSIAILVFVTDDPKLIQRDTAAWLAGEPGGSVVGDDLPLPATRRWRNQWTHSGGVVGVDMAKARVQRMVELRAERDSRLAASDASILRAQEQNDVPAVNDLKTKRQALRDLPVTMQAAVDAITDPDALAAYAPVWPL